MTKNLRTLDFDADRQADLSNGAVWSDIRISLLNDNDLSTIEKFISAFLYPIKFTAESAFFALPSNKALMYVTGNVKKSILKHVDNKPLIAFQANANYYNEKLSGFFEGVDARKAFPDAYREIEQFLTSDRSVEDLSFTLDVLNAKAADKSVLSSLAVKDISGYKKPSRGRQTKKEAFNRLFDESVVEEKNRLISSETKKKYDKREDEINNAYGSVIEEESDLFYKCNSRTDTDKTFETFIPLPENRKASCAIIAAVENPDSWQNPLVIYGSRGTGKSHILNAAANYALSYYQSPDVLFVKAEQFTNDFINALHASNGKRESILKFQKKYRDVDFLFVDDIDFFSGKKETTKEFENTIRYLKENGKQIILSSSVVPEKLTGFDTEFIKNLRAGFPVELQSPKKESALQIVKERLLDPSFIESSKSKGASSLERNKNFRAYSENVNSLLNDSRKMFSKRANTLDVSESVLYYLAKNYSTNVRDLLGAISRILSASVIEDVSNITLSFVKSVLKDYESSITKVSPSTIVNEVSNYFNITIDDLKGSSRKQNVLYARQVAMFLVRNYTSESFPKIGLEFGGKNHATVIHAVDKIENLIPKDSGVKKDISMIRYRIRKSQQGN